MFTAESGHESLSISIRDTKQRTAVASAVVGVAPDTISRPGGRIAAGHRAIPMALQAIVVDQRL